MPSGPQKNSTFPRPQKHYEAIFASDMVGIVVCDPQGHMIEANDCFLKFLGYTPEEFKAGTFTWQSVTAPSSLALAQTATEQLQALGHARPFEKEYVHKAGHTVQALVCFAQYGDGSVVALVIDISDQKKVERQQARDNTELKADVRSRTDELLQSEQFLNTIFEHIPNMVFVKSAEDLSFVRFNKAGEDLIGVPRSELIGKNDYDFFPKEQADLFTQADRKVLSNARIVDIAEEEIQTARGPRLLHTRKIPVFDKNGKPEYLLGVSEDITEHKQTETQRMDLLHEQVAREGAEAYAQQMRFLSDISYVLTETFDTEALIMAFCRKVVTDFADFCVIDLLSEDGVDVSETIVAGRDKLEEEYVKNWRKRHPLRWDANQGAAYVMRTGKGELIKEAHLDEVLKGYGGDIDSEPRLIPVESYMIVPIKARDKKTFGTAMFIAKTKERAFSDEDYQLGDEIAFRLAMALENARLYVKAQEANRSKTAFLANVSHEVRTPLGAMLGFAEIVREDRNLSDESVEAIETVMRNGAQLLRIVDEILDISKVESDRIQIEEIPAALKPLLDDVIHLLQVRAEEKGIELISDYQELPEYVLTDPTRIRQILINIMGNAIKFTDHGSVTLRAGVKSFDPAKKRGCLVFSIVDTGIGISEVQREKLFQPFAQADSSTTRRFGGTGLGLFLSRKLARLLGGDVVLEHSHYGQGSTFVVTIGFKESSQEAIPEFALKSSEMVEGYSQIQRILVADDAADNRELFHRYLVKLGIPCEKIVVVSNGREALEKALQENFSLVLMDIQMPEMDGFQVVKELKEKNYRGLLVALTAHAMKGDEKRCLDGGFDGYLQKPLCKIALQKILSQANSKSYPAAKTKPRSPPGVSP